MERAKQRLVDDRLLRQEGVVAWWQLAGDGLTRPEIEWVLKGWRAFHRGVYLSGHASPTPWQRWYAATLTQPGTALARWSLAAYLGLREAADTEPAHVVRPGSGRQHRFERPNTRGRPDEANGRAGDVERDPEAQPGVDDERHAQKRLDTLWVKYSKTLEGETELRDRVLCTTPARCILDLCLVMSERQRDRLFRDAVRTRVVDRRELAETVRRHAGERGVRRLKALLAAYQSIPIERTRSDPEIEGLVVLRDAGFDAPLVNVEIAGGEADIALPDQKKIFELDGPQYHQFPERDAAKRAAWEAAGWSVERFHTDTPYDDPDELVRAARR